MCSVCPSSAAVRTAVCGLSPSLLEAVATVGGTSACNFGRKTILSCVSSLARLIVEGGGVHVASPSLCARHPQSANRSGVELEHATCQSCVVSNITRCSHV